MPKMEETENKKLRRKNALTKFKFKPNTSITTFNRK
jgi:hypothetical protein